MLQVLFALFMVLPWALSDNVSTKSGLKIFRDEYKSVTAACLDLGFAKKACNSEYYTGNISHLHEEFLSLRALGPTSDSSIKKPFDIAIIIEIGVCMLGGGI